MKKRNGLWLFIIILCSIIGLAQYTYGFKTEELKMSESKNSEVEEQQKDENILTIHFLDVGQGDAIFIELPNDQNMMIDGAEAKEKEKIMSYINKLNCKKIDYLIATHPHADHIGGLATIIKEFDIGKIYMPKAISTSKTYENLLNTIIEKDLKVTTAKKDLVILDDEDLKIKFLSPKETNYQELNNYSAVLKITFQNHSFLFMGDAEKLIEDEITVDVKADIIKVGHHGSNTSSSIEFVNRVHPTYAIISVGAKNQYNHPHEQIIKRWQQIGAQVLETDKSGTIIAKSNGNNLQIETEK
ncbi:MAG: MBL fold metallo-hydrolase [Bacilli bacterium]|nr:MBL fold metallo-hydrolase [Bacilli bacterium]